MNFVGLAAAAATFLGVWFGHLAVRKLESVSSRLWLPAVLFAASGLAFEWLALSIHSQALSAIFGIFGMTLLWDALEFVRQQRRVINGHAPANPANPRHARLLAEHPAATTLDLLKRDPLGRAVSPEEAIILALEKEQAFRDVPS